MVRLGGSVNTVSKRNAAPRDYFATVMFIGLLGAAVLVCGVMVAVPLLAALLGWQVG